MARKKNHLSAKFAYFCADGDNATYRINKAGASVACWKMEVYSNLNG